MIALHLNSTMVIEKQHYMGAILVLKLQEFQQGYIHVHRTL